MSTESYNPDKQLSDEEFRVKQEKESKERDTESKRLLSEEYFDDLENIEKELERLEPVHPTERNSTNMGQYDEKYMLDAGRSKVEEQIEKMFGSHSTERDKWAEEISVMLEKIKAPGASLEKLSGPEKETLELMLLEWQKIHEDKKALWTRKIGYYHNYNIIGRKDKTRAFLEKTLTHFAYKYQLNLEIFIHIQDIDRVDKNKIRDAIRIAHHAKLYELSHPNFD